MHFIIRQTFFHSVLSYYVSEVNPPRCQSHKYNINYDPKLYLRRLVAYVYCLLHQILIGLGYSPIYRYDGIYFDGIILSVDFFHTAQHYRKYTAVDDRRTK